MGDFKLSTGMKNAIAAVMATDWNANNMVLRIYGSPTSQAAADALIPAATNTAIGAATLLVTISNNSAGTAITLNTTPTDGVLTKTVAETWSGVIAASGYPSFYRASAIADTGALSTTEKRYQGTAGALNKSLIVQAYMTLGQTQPIDGYALGVPGE